MGNLCTCFVSKKTHQDLTPCDEEVDINWFDSIPGTNIPSFICEICTENRPLHGSFNINGCSHVFCINCVVHYIISKLDDNILRIVCPVPDCPGDLNLEHCRFILPVKVFNRWGIALTESAIPEWQKFYCPYKDCSKLMINEKKDCLVELTCGYCKRIFCMRCKESWHDGMDCGQFQTLKKNGPDAFFKDAVKRNQWKSCPSCRMYVQRIGGCNIITCRCRRQFCYDCRTVYMHRSKPCPCTEPSLRV